MAGRFANGDSAEALAACIDENTRAVFCETVGNPAGNICDIDAIARMAHARGLPLIVDNTVATPVLLKPAQHGADIIVHSLTKFMGGHGNAMGGMLLDAGSFDWMAPQRTLPAIHHARIRPITAWSMPSASAAPPSLRAPAASISARPALSFRP